MKTFIAWHNLGQHKWQAAMAVSGVGFAIFLMFLQTGLRAAVGQNAVIVYDALDFDLAIVSPQYSTMAYPGSFPRNRLLQARAIPGVAAAAPLYVCTQLYRNPDSHLPRSVIVMAVNPADRPFCDRALNDRLGLIAPEDTALIDTASLPQCGPLCAGVATELDGRRIRTVGTYSIGTGFIGSGSLILADTSYTKIVSHASLDQVNVGLIRLAEGADPAATAARLAALLGPDVVALTRERFEDHERNYFINIKPIGIMFTFGMWLSFVVGAITVYQVLTAETSKRRSEYATLKAMGYTDGYLYRLVFQQAFLFGGLGFGPALLMSLGAYWVLRHLAKVPATMTGTRVLLVFLLTAMMGSLAATLVLRKLRVADPADLF